MLLRAGVRPEWLIVHRVINSRYSYCRAMFLVHTLPAIVDTLIVSLLYRPSRHGTQFLVKWRDVPYDKATWESIGEDYPVKGAYEAVKEFEKIK